MGEPPPTGEQPDALGGILEGFKGIGAPQGKTAPSPEQIQQDWNAAVLALREEQDDFLAKLWWTWNGRDLAKGVRTFDGATWTERTATDADDLTVQFTRDFPDRPLERVAMFSPSIEAGARYAFVLATGDGCAAAGLDGLRPTIPV